jgi:DNA-binding response OmpR family regulator
MPDTQIRKAAWSYVLKEPLRILVADDDPILLEFASVHLSTPTATIVTAPDGLAALDLLRTTACDLAVLDIEMPVLDGFGLLATIRADATLGKLPVMMLTGHEDIASIDRAFTLGANAFAPKPVNWRLLSYQIRYVLRSCSLEREVATKANNAVSQPSSAEQRLRDRCEAILREARPRCDDTRLAAATPEQACLERIAKLAHDALAGGERAEAPMGNAPSLVPPLVNADG